MELKIGLRFIYFGLPAISSSHGEVSNLNLCSIADFFKPMYLHNSELKVHSAKMDSYYMEYLNYFPFDAVI